MTSNLAVDPKEYFRPEFVNRIDDTVTFSELKPEHLAQIVDLQIDRLAERLSDRRVHLVVTDEVRAKLAADGYDPAFGARPLKRVIQRELADRLAEAVLSGAIAEGTTATADLDPSGEIAVS